jgi:ATP-binding cassette subfamily B multidrug efflux pump
MTSPKVLPPPVETYALGLGGQLKSKRYYYLAGSALLVIQQSLMASRDFLVGRAVQAAASLDGAVVQQVALSIFAVSIGSAIARVLSRVTVFTAGRNVEYELRAVLLDRIQRLGPSFFRSMPTGEIMSRATNDLTQVRLLLGFGVLNVMASFAALVSAVYVMTSISVRLTAASFAMLPVLWLVTRSFSSKLFTRTKENQDAMGKMSERTLSSLAGTRVIRSFALVDSELAAFEQSNADYRAKSLALARLRGAMMPVVGSISAVSSLVVYFYGGTLIGRNELLPGDFIAFSIALQRLAWPLMAIGFVAAIIQRGRAGYARLKEVLDAKPEIVGGTADPSTPPQGAIEVRNLSFAYGTKPILRDVSFEVQAGRSLAIVGRTGSGKTTLAALMPRLLATPRGSVFLDGADICDLSLNRVRKNVGYAQQDAFLFSTTVANNIGYSLDDVEEKEALELVRGAAKEAEVLAEIELLPEGFDTVVGERGVQLSGGQRQRIALARALLRKPSLLVLDDPLSAVDAKTEHAILQAIERQKRDRTVILITHRIAAAKRCDQIVVLEEGTITERGSHEELLRLGGTYANFAREQELEEELQKAEAELEVAT